MKRSNPIICYILCAAMFVLGMLAMTDNFSAQFADREKDLAQGKSVLLAPGLKADSLQKLLIDGGYVIDPADAALAARWIAETIEQNGAPANLGELNRPIYKMPAEKALTEGGELFRTRVNNDYEKLGMDAEWNNAKSQNLSSDFGNGPSVISVKVKNDKSCENAALSGITVRLREHRIDSIAPDANSKTKEKKAELTTPTLGYAVTDGNGEARFHVEPGKSYSVVPIALGYQYGQQKGTTATGKLGEGGLTLTFRQQPHVLTPLDTYAYQALKADGALVVRTPAQFKDSLTVAAAIYLIGWLAFFIFLMIRDRKLSTVTDYKLAGIIMVITGIGLLSMFAMTNPLNDKSYGTSMAQALLMGLVAMALVSCVNPAKFFAGKSRLQAGIIPFDPIDRIMAQSRDKRSLTRKSGISFSSGFTYLIGAVALIMLLGMFGTGPEGSDARVNLGGFQPSEVCKYLILIFVAAFFADNAMLLQAFSSKLTPLTARRQLGTIAVVVVVMLGLMMLYLLVLSDMGPALVVLITFIFLYSMARRDFAQLLLGLTTFIGLMLAARALNNTPLTLCIAAASWFVGWGLYGWFRSRQIYESAIIVNLLIVVFALGGPILKMIGAESEAARLTNRTDMSWGGQWDNHVLGGDQVAQGIWSAASGGTTGMGLGNGSPSVVPAFHTDMAFTSIGEMLGFVGLTLLLVCFVLLIHRSLLIGRRAGQPFTMYLVMGIALLTGVQFLFIVFGSLGIVPLTGVTVPFLSYSRTSLVAIMAMFGVVLGASRLRATESQRKYATSFSGAIASSVLMFMIGALVILGSLADYQIIHKDDTLIRPAYITNTMGARDIAYNPRIKMVLNRLHAGNIYDTNGVLLATSSADTLRNRIPSLTQLGLDSESLKRQALRRKARYYTYGDHLLFMLGDAGTKKVLGYQDSDPIGFMAESRYEGELRGIDIPRRKIVLASDKYREDRFMPATHREWQPLERDYRNVIPFLKHGLYNNPEIERFNSESERSQRDLYLTVDANLQKQMNDALASHINSERKFASLPWLRASFVALNAETGELITSSNYPMPNQDTIVMVNDTKRAGNSGYERKPYHKPWTERDLAMTYMTQPGSTAKVITALAGLKQSGTNALQTYQIDLIDEIEGRKDLSGPITMDDAITHSSNNYFIRLLNEQDAFSSIGDIYRMVGTRLDYGTPACAYFFNIGELASNDSIASKISRISAESKKNYNHIMKKKQAGQKYSHNLWLNQAMGIAWGQGYLRATPLAMARVAGIVANKGKLAPTRYVKRIGSQQIPLATPIQIVGANEADILRGYMQHESMRWSNLPNHPGEYLSIGGKTGTPVRPLHKVAQYNDAWYICFVYSKKLNAHLALALRLERTNHIDSRLAAGTMAECIIPTLNAAGYQIY